MAESEGMVQPKEGVWYAFSDRHATCCPVLQTASLQNVAFAQVLHAASGVFQ